MVSSPDNNNNLDWANKVHPNHVVNNHRGIPLCYGDTDVSHHPENPGVRVHRTVHWHKSGASLLVGDPVYGLANLTICYPNGMRADYDIYFPRFQSIDLVAAYALDTVRNILYINLNNAIYSVNLDDAHHNGRGEFVPL